MPEPYGHGALGIAGVEGPSRTGTGVFSTIGSGSFGLWEEKIGENISLPGSPGIGVSRFTCF